MAETGLEPTTGVAERPRGTSGCREAARLRPEEQSGDVTVAAQACVAPARRRFLTALCAATTYVASSRAAQAASTPQRRGGAFGAVIPAQLQHPAARADANVWRREFPA